MSDCCIRTTIFLINTVIAVTFGIVIVIDVIISISVFLYCLH